MNDDELITFDELCREAQLLPSIVKTAWVSGAIVDAGTAVADGKPVALMFRRECIEQVRTWARESWERSQRFHAVRAAATALKAQGGLYV